MLPTPTEDRAGREDDRRLQRLVAELQESGARADVQKGAENDFVLLPPGSTAKRAILEVAERYGARPIRHAVLHRADVLRLPRTVPVSYDALFFWLNAALDLGAALTLALLCALLAAGE